LFCSVVLLLTLPLLILLPLGLLLLLLCRVVLLLSLPLLILLPLGLLLLLLCGVVLLLSLLLPLLILLTLGLLLLLIGLRLSLSFRLGLLFLLGFWFILLILPRVGRSSDSQHYKKYGRANKSNRFHSLTSNVSTSAPVTRHLGHINYQVHARFALSLTALRLFAGHPMRIRERE
jgi:hypothetical protein